MCLVLFCTNALALRTPKSQGLDFRITKVVYNKADLVPVIGHFGFQNHIVFSEDERIVSITMGDSSAWEVATYDNHVFLKPKDNAPLTNAVIITNKRHYNFVLQAYKIKPGVKTKNMNFEIVFTYPADDAAKLQAEANEKEAQRTLGLLKEVQAKQAQEIQKRIEQAQIAKDSEIKAIDAALAAGDSVTNNTDFWAKGDEQIMPVAMFDTDRFTILRFSKGSDIPAIFQVNDDFSESIINFTVKDNLIVLPQIIKNLRLRKGNQIVCIENRGYQAATETPMTGTASSIIIRELKNESNQ